MRCRTLGVISMPMVDHTQITVYIYPRDVLDSVDSLTAEQGDIHSGAADHGSFGSRALHIA